MPRGASPKREREYEKLKSSFRREGRYRGREEEVAARIVNKQRREYGETKVERQKDREGRSPDRGLPIPEYQRLTVAQARRRLESLSKRDLRRIRSYEEKHKNRRTLLQAIDARL
jgi:hypothetical protein